MFKKDVIQHFGSVTATAHKLRVTRGAVSQWPDNAPIPEGRAWQVEAISGGALRVDPRMYAKEKEAAA